MSELRYPVPWKVVLSIGPDIWRGTESSVNRFSAGFTSRMQPAPFVTGVENFPESPRFVLAVNHYQRPGLWIAHVASALTQAVRARYGEMDPPVRWVVTANWPPLRIGSWKLPSPGDWLLPRVAKALCCYPVAFAGSNPEFTARTLRRLLRDARTLPCPIGIFPEGAGGTAGKLLDPLPGVDRLLRQLAKSGWPVLPVGIGEKGSLLIRVGELIPTKDLVSAGDPARLVMEGIRRALPVDLTGGSGDY